MVLDHDIEGIIAASCFLFIFVVIATICLAVMCQRRMERRKRIQILKNAVKDSHQKTRDKVSVNAHTHSALSTSEASSDSPTRIGGYRPKILAIEEESVTGGVSRDSLKDREYQKWKYSKRKGSSLKSTERYRQNLHNAGKAVSVVYVNGKTTQNGWIRDTQPKKQVVEGFVSISQVHNSSQRSSGEVAQSRIHQNSDYFNKGYSIQHGGELVRGHHVTDTGGQLVRGQIIKQNVVMGQDGKLVVTGSEQRDLGNIVRGHVSRQHQESTTVITPGGGQVVRGHIIRQNVELGDDGKFVVTGSEQRELSSGHGPYSITSPQIVHGQAEFETGNSNYTVSGQDGPQIVRGHYSSGREESYHVTKEERRDVHGLLITEDHVVEGWENADDAAAEELEEIDRVPDIVVSDEENDRNARDLVVPKRHESISEFYNDRNKLKVIKKHSAHKPPDWLVQTYKEEGANMDSSSATQVATSALETEEYYRRSAQTVTFNEVSTEIQDAEIIDDDDDISGGEIVSSFSQREAQYPDGGHGTYTVTDYVDPERQGHMVTQTYQNSEHSDTEASSTYMSTTSMTATSRRRMRQEVNESAERIPPAFTSTPRVPWEAETVFVVSGHDIDHRRQRGANTSDDDIPLPPL